MSDSNTALIYSNLPGHGLPELGKTLSPKTAAFDAKGISLDGGVLARVLCVSFDPYQRRKMRAPELTSYSPAYRVGEPMDGHIVVKIVRSEKAGYDVGTRMWGTGSFQDWLVLKDADLGRFRVIPEELGLTSENWIGACGMPGQTAFVGLYKYGEPKRSEKIFISAASGAVGQIVGQLAKREGLTVIGSAGSPEKVKILKEKLGFDHAFCCKTEDTLTELKKHEPIQLYFDNVGAETLDAFISVADRGARIIACGAISDYGTAEPRGIRNAGQIVPKCLKIQGFIVFFEQEYLNKFGFWDKLPAWVADKSIKVLEDVTYGWDKAEETFVGMLAGKNLGKTILRVAGTMMPDGRM